MAAEVPIPGAGAGLRARTDGTGAAVGPDRLAGNLEGCCCCCSLAFPFLLAVVALLVLLGLLIELGALARARAGFGIGHRYVFGLLLLSLPGSYVNVPVAVLPARQAVVEREEIVDGTRFAIPRVVHQQPLPLAVNVGGAVIPVLLSVALAVKNSLLLRSLLGIVLVAVAVHPLARVSSGVGIIAPGLVPPAIAAMVGLLLGRKAAPPLAYVCGVLGTLLGVDLTHLDAVRDAGAPLAAIGGAGTFDGIFITGVLALLLAAMRLPPLRRPPGRS